MTAIEWLVDQILNNKGARVISTSTFYIKDEVVEQAKEMEYKQIIDARAITKTGYEIAEAEEYYFETYGRIHKTRNI